MLGNSRFFLSWLIRFLGLPVRGLYLGGCWGETADQEAVRLSFGLCRWNVGDQGVLLGETTTQALLG